MDVGEFDYELPEDLIAQTPLAERDGSRLLVDRGAGARPQHLRVSDLDTLLQSGDVLVVNNTRVLAARLRLFKRTGGAVEVLLLEPTGDGGWEALVKPSRRVDVGAVLRADHDGLTVVVGEPIGDGTRRVEVRVGDDLIVDVRGATALDALGETPLPPYIRTSLSDAERYQTVYAAVPGSVAAPTAGLHFTPELLQRVQKAGASIRHVELVVGMDTFRPLMVDDTDDHVMHSEIFRVSDETLQACEDADRVIAVGTTTVRALESAASGIVGDRTDLFIQRGYEWKVVDALMTNFHMPRSTLLVMIDAFIGPRWRDLYLEAIAERYRFLSFGDAMFLTR